MRGHDFSNEGIELATQHRSNALIGWSLSILGLVAEKVELIETTGTHCIYLMTLPLELITVFAEWDGDELIFAFRM